MKLIRRQKAPYLMPPFKVARAHMDVENMQCSAGRFQIGTNTAASFSMLPGDVHIPGFDNRPSGEDRVTVRAAAMVSGAAESGLHSQGGSERLNLSLSSFTEREDLLKRDDVCIEIAEHIRDAFDGDPAVNSAAFVNIVGNDAHRGILPRELAASRSRMRSPHCQPSELPCAYAMIQSWQAMCDYRSRRVYVLTNRPDRSRVTDHLVVISVKLSEVGLMRVKGQLCLMFFVLTLTAGLTSCERGRGVEAAREDRPAAVTQSEEEFMAKAAQANMTEIEVARIALQKSANDEVKEYANVIKSDHTSALEDLAELMEEKNVAQPRAIDARTQQDIDRMNNLTGGEFDREFINMMVTDHRKAIELFRDQQSSAQNRDVKKYVDKVLPNLEVHLDKAQRLQTKLFSAPPNRSPATR